MYSKTVFVLLQYHQMDSTHNNDKGRMHNGLPAGGKGILFSNPDSLSNPTVHP